MNENNHTINQEIILLLNDRRLIHILNTMCTLSQVGERNSFIKHLLNILLYARYYTDW